MVSSVAKKINDFFNKFEVRKFQKGEILIQKDESPDEIFYLLKGKVRQYSISTKGDELEVNIFKKGAFFPMSLAINNSVNDFYFEALTTVVINVAPKKAVIDFLKREPDVLYDLLARVYLGIDGILKKMTNIMGEDAIHRIITELLIQAKRFGTKEGKKVRIKITEKEIASLTGLQRETVSRNIKLLKNKNLLSLTNREILINNLHLLETVS